MAMLRRSGDSRVISRPADQDRAGAHRNEARDRAQQGGLAAARRAEQGHELARRDLQRDAVQNPDRPVGDLDPLDGQRSVVHIPVLPRLFAALRLGAA